MQRVAPRRAKAGRQIGNRALGQIAREPIERSRCRPDGAAPACARRGARADDQVVLVQVRHEADCVGGLVLSVSVEDEHELARGLADAGLDRGAVALVVRMADHARARSRGCAARPSSSVEPSSTTMISRHGADGRRIPDDAANRRRLSYHRGR